MRSACSHITRASNASAGTTNHSLAGRAAGNSMAVILKPCSSPSFSATLPKRTPTTISSSPSGITVTPASARRWR